jgi:hypothetical protein
VANLDCVLVAWHMGRASVRMLFSLNVPLVLQYESLGMTSHYKVYEEMFVGY